MNTTLHFAGVSLDYHLKNITYTTSSDLSNRNNKDLSSTRTLTEKATEIDDMTPKSPGYHDNVTTST